MTRWWRSHSLRMRLTLWLGAAMVVVLGVYMAVIYAVVSRSVSQALNQQIRNDLGFAEAIVERQPDGTFSFMPDGLLPEDDLWFQLWTDDARELLDRNLVALRNPLDSAQQLAAAATTGDNQVVSVAVPPVPMRLLSQRTTISDVPVVLQVGRSEAAMRRDLRDLLFVLVVGLPLAVLVAGFGAYWLARRALAPVERMAERARLITAERLGERLPVHNPDDEMGRLASVFNETLGRLEESFEQMRRFTADVSHELRTPLTAIRSVGEVGLRGQRDEAGYRAMVESMLEEADRLASLVDRLLTLSRAETGQTRLSRELIDLQQLIDEAAAHLSVLAEEKGQTFAVVRDATPQALADRLALRQAVINLIDNAIKFTPAGGRIQVRIGETARDAVIDVTDSGPGIPAEASAHIFDRFYRVSDRGGAAGSGLGLSIAKGAVEANGGRLTLERTGPDGSTFRMAVPRQTEVVQTRRRAG